jgi:tRNA-dihydrouridine synthase A
MMAWTDRHCRYFHRLLAPHARLYTEMVHSGAILFGDVERHLDFSPEERPVALQLGGSEPDELARAASIGAGFGYDEINLNCGCPSERVQRGGFGAWLMAEPVRVAECVAAMRAAVGIRVTVKCRIGVDDSEEREFLHRFVETVAGAGCTTFLVHARKAWLKGLSPKENREIPPLRYEIVDELKRAFPALTIVLNGGLREPAAAVARLDALDGLMIGREAYENPWSLTVYEQLLFSTPPPTRDAVLEHMVAYAGQQAKDLPVRAVTRHMLGLYNGLPGARAFRRRLSAAAPEDGPGLLREAAALVRTPETVAA